MTKKLTESMIKDIIENKLSLVCDTFIDVEKSMYYLNIQRMNRKFGDEDLLYETENSELIDNLELLVKLSDKIKNCDFQLRESNSRNVMIEYNPRENIPFVNSDFYDRIRKLHDFDEIKKLLEKIGYSRELTY